ncbi:hypothetical protein RirG_166330 [Rhizophagus irregularis DAOM 197198w]|uniref:Uncharacterized protein n=1 Tax=Rhizophagus irregularis (strain DAOM 197198w) TaxID=1432141 RepID=A0A015K3E5_RHIIW|nr:hypothetical protein RirG_166330 [Rhizophagus irregularis DAOM 197198w]
MRPLNDVARIGIYLLDQFFLKKTLTRSNTFAELRGWRSLDFNRVIVGIIPCVFLPENIRESAKSESRGESVANRSKVEKNWRILDEAIVISYSVFRLLRIGFNKNLELPLL